MVIVGGYNMNRNKRNVVESIIIHKYERREVERRRERGGYKEGERSKLTDPLSFDCNVVTNNFK